MHEYTINGRRYAFDGDGIYRVSRPRLARIIWKREIDPHNAEDEYAEFREWQYWIIAAGGKLVDHFGPTAPEHGAHSVVWPA